MSYADERYRKPPTLADADALRAIRRDVEIRKLMRDLIAALASLYTTPPDGQS
jgi:hypothetical protein